MRKMKLYLIKIWEKIENFIKYYFLVGNEFRMSGEEPFQADIPACNPRQINEGAGKRWWNGISASCF